MEPGQSASPRDEGEIGVVRGVRLEGAISKSLYSMVFKTLEGSWDGGVGFCISLQFYELLLQGQLILLGESIAKKK